MKIILTLLLLSISLFIYSRNPEIDSLLNQLDHTIKENKIYIDLREMRINSLKNLLKESDISLEAKYSLNTRLFIEYKAFILDSAIRYLNLNLEISEILHKDEWLNETKFRLAHLLTAVGIYKESFDILETIRRNQLPDYQKSDYYSCCEHINSELSYYSPISANADYFRKLSRLYKDSLLNSLEPQSDEYLRIKELQLLEEGKVDESEKINSILFMKTKEGTPEYALLTYRKAIINRTKDNTELFKKYLTISAITDIKAAIKDNASLTLLALLLYEKNEIDRAYEYIEFSLEDAKFFNTRLRLAQISNILPLINSSYQIKSEKQKAKLQYYLIVISILSILLLFTIFFIYKQLKKLSRARNELEIVNSRLTDLNLDLKNFNNQLKELNVELSETNHIKEQYIGLFLSICSTYIDKLDNYRKTVNRQISSGKTAELFETTKSKELIEQELKEFYDNFDNTFLHLFPNFVDEINSLLKEDEKIQIKKGELLNTELRIFALIRLGISDSSKIAGLLRYSVNTIYNYRVKTKNKSSVPRDEFENFVMKIGSSRKMK